ncbi:thiol reductant ABC exporter subunit CydD [Fredinandcohnia sp. 179-A 10B2 NHS]|uniref:thiol reductant ABC exporter subunit CydD n=1 Tax=Fredinandcohnia sp. 179-A 10B2 NHS TaxID=3235176 RepID=UPI0039A20C3D
MDKYLFQTRGIRRIVAIVAFLTIGQGVAIIAQAIFLAQAITDLYKGTAFSAVLPVFLLFLGMLCLRYILDWIKGRITYHFASQISDSTQAEMIQKLFKLGPRAIGNNGSGNLITLCLEGITNYRTYLELFIPRFLSMLFIPIILLIYLFTVDILSGTVLVVTMPIMIVFLILLGLVAKKQIQTQWGTYQLLSRHFVDSLRGLVTLKYLGISKSHQKAIESVSDSYRKATNRTLRVAFLSTFSLDFFSSLAVAVVAVELGLRLINGHVGLQSALVILILAPEYFLPIRSFGNDYHATMDGKEAGRLIKNFLDEKEEVEVEKGIFNLTWCEDSTLSVQNLSKYSGEQAIIQNIHFSVDGFKKVGIIGLSGAGKSTLIDILSGMSLPTEGSIFVNGTAVEHLAIKSWLNQVVYIPQHPYIFSGTLSENICWYKPDASNEEIQLAIEKAGLTEIVDQLPNGLHEKIGEGGRSLSGGEEQRIALARSFLKNSTILLFDEPTAHLDIETEFDIKNMILPFLEDKLVFFATHRMHWMRAMDIIIVLDKGRLVEMGTHEELAALKGAYYRLLNAQLRGGQHEAVSEIYSSIY